MKAARESHTVHREFGSAHTMPMQTTEEIPIPAMITETERDSEKMEIPWTCKQRKNHRRGGMLQELGTDTDNRQQTRSYLKVKDSYLQRVVPIVEYSQSSPPSKIPPVE